MLVQAAGCSNLGQLRSVNQDRYSVRAQHVSGTWDALMTVVDGMGGHQAGEVASELAVDQVVQVCESADTPTADLEGTLRRAIVKANDTIRRAAAAAPALRGMGPTVTVALLRDHKLYVGHVGDSRLYVVRGRSIFQLTQDHSWVAREVPDNFTTVVARVADREGESRRTRELAVPCRRHHKRRTIAIALGVAGGVLALIGLAIAASQDLTKTFAHLVGQS